MGGHLTKDPPTDDSKEQWMEEDACLFDVCKTFYQSEKQDQSLTEFFMAYKKIHEELNMLMPFSPDVKVQQSQREQIAIMGFLAALPSEYDSAKAQILSSPMISSL